MVNRKPMDINIEFLKVSVDCVRLIHYVPKKLRKTQPVLLIQFLRICDLH